MPALHALRDELIWMMIGYDPIYPDHYATLVAGIVIGGVIFGSIGFKMGRMLRRRPA